MSMKMRPVKRSQKRTKNPNSSTERTSREKPTERVRPAQPERKELWHIPEPLLEFAHGQMVEYPRDGLYLFGPCDAQKRSGVTRYGVIGTREGIMRTRGKWFDYDTGTRVIRALPTFHPAYLLRSPPYKRMSWQDLRAIAKVLAQ